MSTTTTNLTEEVKQLPNGLPFNPNATNQCLFIVTLPYYNVLYSEGIKQMLGFSHLDFNKVTFFESIHPEDAPIAAKVLSNIMEHCYSNDMSGEGQFFNITFRFKTKKGIYINLWLKAFIHKMNEKGEIFSAYIILNDISFLNTNTVQWSARLNNFDTNKFRRALAKELNTLFTNRELDIIHALQKGWNTNTIAEKLFISQNTVTTHRKKILKKANCNNTQCLLLFCKSRGVI